MTCKYTVNLLNTITNLGRYLLGRYLFEKSFRLCPKAATVLSCAFRKSILNFSSGPHLFPPSFSLLHPFTDQLSCNKLHTESSNIPRVFSLLLLPSKTLIPFLSL
ncbi:hypothetical protein LINGRAHAP2_LOCUS18491 [Linum grandiflorum]